MTLLDDLIHKVSEFYYLKQQINRLLEYYTKRIQELLTQIKQKTIEDADKIFIELFEIQRTLSTIKYKYLFEFDDFLNDFVYFFDRQDEFNKFFLYKHFSQHTNFPE